ncbi:MAG: DUF1330 domain-containing protein [Gammaproteobacteria bacterium]|jgi:uncharacterized protein (DUF1330 family)|tara:strand:+ start:78 stop:374 length:297 start_codon:yes stop_codon:yes gene_type:complete
MSVYLVSVCEITNMSNDLKEYAQKSAELIQKFGGSYVTRGPATEIYEGGLLANKSVIITKFPDIGSVHAFWESDEYSAIKPKREGTGVYDIGVYQGAE